MKNKKQILKSFEKEFPGTFAYKEGEYSEFGTPTNKRIKQFLSKAIDDAYQQGKQDGVKRLEEAERERALKVFDVSDKYAKAEDEERMESVK